MKLKFILFFIFVNILTYSQTIQKTGGICFRTDDNQAISNYLDYASVFNKYNKNFTFALNLDITNINSDYINGVKQLQANGHEMMDHSPSHKIPFFYTILSPDYFTNHPGIEKISGNKICLKHDQINISNSKWSGVVNIDGNMVTSSEGIFAQFSKYDCYLYFPSLDKLVYINDYSNNWIDDNTVKITDVWNYSINLGKHTDIQVHSFENTSIPLTIDAIKAIAEESLRLSDHYGFNKPKTWIQPGGYHPFLHKEPLKDALSGDLGYKAAGNFVSPSIKVYNEYNPNNDKQFGMNWADFYDDKWTLQECKTTISDRVAKHHVAIGHSHFSDLLGGWSGFLERTEEIIKWCIQKDIPIRTYEEWADILYNKTPDPNQNIFPKLDIDNDGNGYPDGYFKKSKVSSSQWLTYDGQWINNDGVPESKNHSFSINKVGNICFVGKYYYYQDDGLGGLEKGENDFSIWTKGAPGNFIEVDFKIGSDTKTFKFSAETSNWTNYNLTQSINGNTSLYIPSNISITDVTIRCSDYSSGTVKISGLSLKKMSFQDTPPQIYSQPNTEAVINEQYSYDVNASGTPKPTYSLTSNPVGMVINESTGVIEWLPTMQGNFDIQVVASNRIDPEAIQTFTIQVDTLQFIILPPSNILFSNISYNSVILNWRDNSTNETNFYVHRKISGGEWEHIYVANQNSETYRDISLSPATNYCYKFQAYNSDEDVFSDYSDTKCFNTDSLLIKTPTEFSVSIDSNNCALLTWKDMSEHETSFVIERKEQNTDWQEIKILPENMEFFIDSTLSYNSEYCYKIGSVNNVENISSDKTYTKCVQTLKEQFNIVVVINPQNSGTVTGSGLHSFNDYVQLTALPNKGYKFRTWTEGDTIISVDSIFNFVATTNKNIFANFDLLTDLNNYELEIPNKYSLSECYPNPFNPKTNINFSIPQASIVSADIIDINGKIVKNIINKKNLSPGIYNKNINAEGLSSGIYFLRFKAENFIETKKIILLK